MRLVDSPDLRTFLRRVLPNVTIQSTPKASGQRVVYFCTADAELDAGDYPLTFSGRCVVKASQGASAQAIAYIQREINILNSLGSPHFPVLLHNDVFYEDPDTEERFAHPVFITIEEYIEGTILSACLAAYRTERAVLELLRQLVSALVPLWSRRPSIVHRDLKPDNIIIRPCGQSVIIDLGIAREAESDGVTLTFAPFGPCTPCYASPEQARNDKRSISFRSDIFSLGVIGYELLAGEKPFCSLRNEDASTILERILTSDPIPISEKAGVTNNTGRLITKMLEKEPYRRHRRPEYLLADLEEAIANV
jgi:eukaryotic-like serine/threonine-protein kinase